MNILVVEDDILIGLALKAVLYIAGHHVSGPASSASDALRQAEADPPELAFIDINIRGDRNGVVVARVLTERHGTSCIFLTAQIDEARRARDVAIGVIGKPYDPPALLQAVKIVAAMRHGEQLAPRPGHLELF